MKNIDKNRKSLRLPNYDYSGNGAYFITICIKNRECLLGKGCDRKVILNEFGLIVTKIWSSLTTRYEQIELDEFVVMPNHIHGIIIINPVGTIHELSLQGELSLQKLSKELSIKERRKMLLPKAIGYFKMNSAKQINQMRQTVGMSLWQSNYYEHIIRDETALNRIREYIINNPLKWHEDIENPQGNPDRQEIQFWQDVGWKNLDRK
jgi:REP element-mobilizing transposase RayT